MAEELELLLEEKDYLKYLQKKINICPKQPIFVKNHKINFVVKIPGGAGSPWSWPPWKDAGGEK